MATHYDVLGASPHASVEDLRRAYLRLARELHPDRTMGRADGESERAARRMQEVNEAWRVLREPASRAAYDRWLAGGRRTQRPVEPTPAPAGPPSPPRHALRPEDDEDDWDTPFTSAPAEPGDLGVSVARVLPWLAVAVVLVVIFVYTAFAGGEGDPTGPQSLVGRCISSGGASAIVPVPCEGPNEGEVVLLVGRPSLCPDGSTGLAVEEGDWLCLKPHNDIPQATAP